MKQFNWNWITDPNAWVAIGTIAALILSGWTYYSLYYNPGAIDIYMPDDVGLNLYKYPSFQIYPTFSNSGSPNTWKIIRNINAIGWIQREDKPDEEIKFDWKYVDRFLSIQDYEHNYKKPNETISNDTTFFVLFESYRAPFNVPGEQTVSKLLEFTSSSKTLNFSEPFIFEVEIEVTTMDNKIYKSPKIFYYGSNSTASNITTRPIFRWISRFK